MGNSSSSSGRGHHDETVDYGFLAPQGVYTGPRDWNQAVVSQLIVARKLAPFYRPLEDYEDDWDDDQILAARKDLPDPENADTVTRIEATHANASRNGHNKRPGMQKEPSKPEAAIYRGSVECPICFLYYPPNINHSRCCDQAICTECFVQIKRNEPTTTHLVSEPAACPYCVQDNFGVVYTPPPWRAGIGSEGMHSVWSDSPKGSQQSIDTSVRPPTHKRRQKSFSADSPEVVTTDQIRPDWEAKLAAVRAAVTRRANRRIIMRQVGDRLIPVGVTSGRVHALSAEEAASAAESAEGGGSRRSRRRQQAQQGQGFEQFMGMAGQDLEELMLMEAMRLSLLDHEEQQRKEAEEKKKQETAAAAASAGKTDEQPSEAPPAPVPGPSMLEVRSVTESSPSNVASSSSSPAPVSFSPSLIPQSANGEVPGHKRKSWSLSRSRTPPPPANHASNTSPGDESSLSTWRRRTSSPPPFSTLNAALTSTSTAAAILRANADGGDAITPSTNEPHADNISAGSIPSITVGDTPNTPENIVIPSRPENGSVRPDSQADSASSLYPDRSGSALSSYGQLPSSPESGVDQEPLLSHEPVPSAESEHPKKVTTSNEEPRHISS
ncbi:hypothetical protein BDQ12DRAFT_677073 [Crucibulum laeve]|uniref:RING-type domain-containing protein n=1 Tax=Crucibulum laeve TaxID=68775 RepID=A0A5C3MCQ6_9AGAR|nr:hypothetical protein BDQ12DRAFT_677073 [Crucibulum laeve]